jgi:hypothetical protein
MINNISEGGRSQNLILFIRGYAISGIPSIRGTKKCPNPPIIKDITVKKIITYYKYLCLVINKLNTWSLLSTDPQVPNSNRIIILMNEPSIPAQKEKIKYNIPIFLWLVE